MRSIMEIAEMSPPAAPDRRAVLPWLAGALLLAAAVAMLFVGARGVRAPLANGLR